MNIIDYVKNNGHKSFSTLSFNELDALVLARLSYLNYSNINTSFMDVIDAGDLNSYETSILLSKKEMGDIESDKVLVREVLSSKRYYGMKFAYYVNEEDDKQFSAITYIFEDFACVSFKGTDDNVMKWKEDFSLSYLETIPSQKKGIEYLEKVASLFNKPIVLTGHSKGGNIAIYSLFNVSEEVANSITCVYSYDSIGFNKSFIEQKAYDKRKNLIKSFVPETSVMGVLMYSLDEYEIVASSKLALFQNSIYNWIVEDASFMYRKEISKKSRALSQSNKNLIEEFSNEERQVFFESVFDILKDCEINSFWDLGTDASKIGKIVNKSNKLSKENKELMKILVKNMISSYLDLLFDRKKQ